MEGNTNGNSNSDWITISEKEILKTQLQIRKKKGGDEGQYKSMKLQTVVTQTQKLKKT